MVCPVVVTHIMTIAAPQAQSEPPNSPRCPVRGHEAALSRPEPFGVVATPDISQDKVPATPDSSLKSESSKNRIYLGSPPSTLLQGERQMVEPSDTDLSFLLHAIRAICMLV
jgi:hypothetical protein